MDYDSFARSYLDTLGCFVSCFFLFVPVCSSRAYVSRAGAPFYRI